MLLYPTLEITKEQESEENHCNGDCEHCSTCNNDYINSLPMED
jgi:hypothetical protein